MLMTNNYNSFINIGDLQINVFHNILNLCSTRAVNYRNTDSINHLMCRNQCIGLMNKSVRSIPNFGHRLIVMPGSRFSSQVTHGERLDSNGNDASGGRGRGGARWRSRSW